jgi:hypothetical protein
MTLLFTGRVGFYLGRKYVDSVIENITRMCHVWEKYQF